MVKTFLSNPGYMNLHHIMRNELENASITKIDVIITNKGDPSPTKGVNCSAFGIWNGVYDPTLAS